MRRRRWPGAARATRSSWRCARNSFRRNRPGRAGENCLNGIVENVVFLGAVVRIHVRVGSSLVLMDEFNNPNLSVPEIGSTIQLYFQRENCLLLVA